MEISFEQAISESPALSDSVKEALLANAATLNEENKQAIIKQLLAYEKDVLAGAQSFLASLRGETKAS